MKTVRRRSRFELLLLLVWLVSPTIAAEQTCRVLDPDIASSYSGECSRGFAHGQGIAQGKDRYEGRFVDGEPHGEGKYVWGRTGSEYVGSFHRGRPNGEGFYVYGPRSKQPGARYEGGFVDGLPNGMGRFEFANGDVYVGMFMKGERTGRGVYKWANGCSLEDTFTKGQGANPSRTRCPPGKRV